MSKKLTPYSFNNIEDRISILKTLFPEAVHEGRLDYDTFMTLLGDEFDNDTEKYRFEWKGKQASLQVAQKQSTATLRPVIEESKNWESTNNLYIEGDNLEVMKLLQRAYLGKVKMIYIDPPYNTGNDFVYKDNFKEPLEGYIETTGQVNKANPETAGRYHSNWLSMMYPRLLIARTLLCEDGVIFISIDDNEQANLKKLCDEVFGEENFKNFIWKKKGGASNTEKIIGNLTEYIVCYFRKKAPGNFNYINIKREYSYEDDISKYNLESIEKTNQGTYERKTMLFPIIHPETKKEFYPSEGKRWTLGKDTVDDFIQQGKLYFDLQKNKVFRIKRPDDYENSNNIYYNLLDNLGSLSVAKNELSDLLGNREVFDTPKPVSLIQHLLKIASSKDSLILDFFSGSSTTAHAVMQLNAEDGGNRQYIMVQLPEVTDEKSEAYKAGYKTIADIGKERIRRAGEKILAEHPDKADSLDIGFKVFKLDSTNLTKWDSDFSNIKEEDKVKEIQRRLQQSIEELKPDRSELDLLYEVMLKYGLPLTEPIVEYKVQGKKFYAIGAEEYLFVCLDSGITREVIVSFVQEYTSGAVIFSDNCFSNDSDIINVEDVLNRAKIDFMWI